MDVDSGYAKGRSRERHKMVLAYLSLCKKDRWLGLEDSFIAEGLNGHKDSKVVLEAPCLLIACYCLHEQKC